MLATRLSEDPNTSVLVIEAGPANLDDNLLRTYRAPLLRSLPPCSPAPRARRSPPRVLRRPVRPGAVRLVLPHRERPRPLLVRSRPTLTVAVQVPQEKSDGTQFFWPRCVFARARPRRLFRLFRRERDLLTRRPFVWAAAARWAGAPRSTSSRTASPPSRRSTARLSPLRALLLNTRADAPTTIARFREAGEPRMELGQLPKIRRQSRGVGLSSVLMGAPARFAD